MIVIICDVRDCRFNENQYCNRKPTLYIGKDKVCKEYSDQQDCTKLLNKSKENTP